MTSEEQAHIEEDVEDPDDDEDGGLQACGGCGDDHTILNEETGLCQDCELAAFLK